MERPSFRLIRRALVVAGSLTLIAAADACGGGMETHSRPPCLTKPSQIVLAGDSYISWITHSFPSDLAKQAGVTYRNYAIGGYSMATGGIGLIPPEFDQAIAADKDIVAVVADGGGNDVLIPDTNQFPHGLDCKNSLTSPMIADCQMIVQRAIERATLMTDTMAAEGVHDVVYFFYPHVPEGTLIGGAHPNAILEYVLPRAKSFCDGAYARSGGRLTCHFVDLSPVFAGHPEYFFPGDIHPNTTGSAAMAQAVWSTMQAACVGQPASSGCCQP